MNAVPTYCVDLAAQWTRVEEVLVETRPQLPGHQLRVGREDVL